MRLCSILDVIVCSARDSWITDQAKTPAEGAILTYPQALASAHASFTGRLPVRRPLGGRGRDALTTVYQPCKKHTDTDKPRGGHYSGLPLLLSPIQGHRSNVILH